MAEYRYKGYIANVYEDVQSYDWGWLESEPTMQVTLRSELILCKSTWCKPDEINTLKHIYIKYFEQAVDKHLNGFK